MKLSEEVRNRAITDDYPYMFEWADRIEKMEAENAKLKELMYKWLMIKAELENELEAAREHIEKMMQEYRNG